MFSVLNIHHLNMLSCLVQFYVLTRLCEKLMTIWSGGCLQPTAMVHWLQTRQWCTDVAWNLSSCGGGHWCR